MTRAARWIRRTCLLPLLLWLIAASPAFARDVAPEGASGFAPQSAATDAHAMAVTAHPAATDAAVAILEAGGSAVDAAIAAQLVLTLVEPQSSGIGGGAFLLHFDGHRVRAYDGRETAPAAATEDLFRRPDGTSMAFDEAMVGGRSVGTPGLLRLLARVHHDGGHLPWAALFAPAIALAEHGFPVGRRLHTLLAADRFLRRDPVAGAYFYDADGAPWPVGHRLKNPELAATLRRIADGGVDAFYRGDLATAIVRRVREHPDNPGRLAAADLAGYVAQERPPVCVPYRAWTVCGMPPPSSGGIAVAQILGLLEGVDLAALAPQDGLPDERAVHLFAEAGRLAFADRARYVADTDFVPLPGNSPAALLDPIYLRRRAALIGGRAGGPAAAGEPVPPPPAGSGLDAERPSTTQLSIVDGEGRAVAMTSSIENAFGARLMVGGFLLNNQLTDFSFAATDAGAPVANRVEGGKRPRSSMAPTLVFDRRDGRLRAILGSPGGSQIIGYVAQTLLALLDWRLPPAAALALPHFGNRNGPTELESPLLPAQAAGLERLADALTARGHTVRRLAMTSGLSVVVRVDTVAGARWQGAADPRREGTARGARVPISALMPAP